MYITCVYNTFEFSIRTYIYKISIFFLFFSHKKLSNIIHIDCRHFIRRIYFGVDTRYCNHFVLVLKFQHVILFKMYFRFDSFSRIRSVRIYRLLQIIFFSLYIYIDCHRTFFFRWITKLHYNVHQNVKCN